ncbi:hypothetical protein ALC57_00982 [Trachymyrmex cornetzi]|uniref:Histone-lysine N-methyltransferase SETMAR n=1 Tax=Trachymyrmex cornetzi TaxID=471704 RepID=A0A195EPB8_9HYME|nr:hypothetical protein ALC57_00982 [Trachymyrmex cornetzi]
MPGRPLKRPGAITFKNSERVESRVCCARLHQTPRRRRRRRRRDENVDKVNKIVLANHRVSEREIASTLSISNGSIHHILTKVLARFGRTNAWILHHDNAPLICDFLIKHTTNTIPHALYSSDMVPYEFFLFPRLKLPSRGKRFDSIDSIKENLT